MEFEYMQMQAKKDAREEEHRKTRLEDYASLARDAKYSIL